ncbi:MAG: heme ABC exporter ATP-binding protein CcmA [Candidatus Zixiibacteriota bacterium]
MYKVEAKQVKKNFAHRKVLRDVSFALNDGDSLAIVGRNGSGKTTLLKILAGLIRPSRGKVIYSSPDGELDKKALRDLLSYVGPEMTLYDPLTAAENLRFFATMRGQTLSDSEIENILQDVGLYGRGNDAYGTYSSGMKQRLKYAVALLNKPKFLLLDEPSANLDDDGKKVVAAVIARQKKDGILLIATNEQGEYAFADHVYRLDD